MVRLLAVSTLVCVLFLMGSTTARFYPATFFFHALFNTKVKLTSGNKWAVQGLVGVHGGLAIWDVINDCQNMQSSQDRQDCAKSVIASAVATGLAAIKFHKTGEWWKRDLQEINDQFKLYLEQAVGAENFVIHDAPHLEKRENGTSSWLSASINVPGGDNNNWLDHVFFDDYVAIVPSMFTKKKSDIIQKRNGFNGYDTTVGIIKVLGNSDPVGYWGDVIDWAFEDSDQFNGWDVAEEIRIQFLSTTDSYGRKPTHFGMALVSCFHGLDGQFMVHAEEWGSNSGWEKGLNWCFGCSKSNC